jgi:hypothetical protein
MEVLDWLEVTRKYEKNMFVRAEEKIRETYENLETIFAKDAPRGIVE